MLRALPRILSGAVPATDIMFPNSSMELVEGIYKNNPITDCFNEIMADAVVAVLQEIVRGNPAARIRILEIGAGTGGGSLRVLEKLKPFASHVETYCYTDVSKSFLLYAEKEYGPKFSYLDYKLFNVEEPLARQSVALGTYDIALATNVLHATRDIRKTLRNAKAVLKENGVLLVNELSGHSLFTHLTFGLLEGWWLYEDAEIRIPGCPGLSPESWQDVLEQEGFGSISFPALALHHLGYQILAADSDGLIRQEMPGTSESKGPDAPKAAKPGARRESPQPSHTQPAANSQSVTDEVLERHVKDIIFEQLNQSLKIDRAQIAEDDAFMDYGIDSILGVQLIQEINRKLGIGLATTDLFDHGSINQLARHIVSAYKAESTASLPSGLTVPTAEPAPLTVVPRKSEVPSAREAPVLQEIAEAGAFRKEPIAIIGMSGRYGRSNSVEELWEHLAQGHDLIEEVSRWDLSRYYPAGAKYCKHGSFIDGIDTFDPVFFKMSGLEATYMDPQQRVFLEESWKALEDAGYAGLGMQGKRCGVYVGCQESGYAQLFAGEAPAQAMWGNALSAMPARISYYLDLQGPAISIDTACSSSLVAIHLACQGLWAGETEMALAGGISIQCTPKFYLIANQAGMLSASGRCHTFDDRADGFVPGEGVGVVVLKRLSDALADGDHIYGVIRGSGINQDGTSNGITAPSAKSQERLETSVYDTFGINPERIQMLEAHGTGTKLGDPIEYHALKRAFGKYTKQTDFCALGSIKTNIGHTTTAAGVAGVIKVLLSLKNRRIPPSLHFERGNAHIDFTNGPFYVNTMNRPWEVSGDGKRCAAVSSFGVSGTNAHVVIEEAPRRAQRSSEQAAHLITLSAYTAEQLKEQVERFIAHCQKSSELDLGDVSFTLLLGRKHCPHRLAFVAHNNAEVIHSLQLWLTKGQSPRVCVGELPDQGHREQASLKNFGNECIRKSVLSTDSESLVELLSTVADLYVQGYRLDYAGLFAARQHVRVSLPTYPFARERYWVPEAQAQAPSHALKAAALHPLLHINVSNFRAQRYQSTFTGDEFFLKDHKVKGQKVLPGVACLEMARAAAAFALGEPGQGGQGIALRNVVWARPVTASQGSKTLTTALTLKGQGEIEYEISSSADDISDADAGALSRVHSQGQAFLKDCTPATLGIQRIKAACDKTELSAAQLYPAYEQIGFEYGSSHRGIERLHIGRDEVLVQLTLPGSVRATRDTFVLHPSLLDATLQASLGMGLAAGNSRSLDVSDMKPSLPFALDELEILGGCTESMWAWIRYSAGVEKGGRVFKLDIDLCDELGGVRARMKGMSYRILDGEVGEIAPQASCVSFLPRWERQSAGVTEAEPLQHIVLLPDMPALASALEAQSPSPQALRLTSAVPGIAERFTDYAVQTLAHVQRILDSKTQQKVLMQLVVPEDPTLSVIQGLLGLLKSAQMEDPRLLAQAVLVDTGESVARLLSQVTAGRQHASDACIRFRDGETEVLTWVEDSARPEFRVPWKNGGVYLITGGLGGIATLVAKDMSAQVQDVTLVLAGRSPLRPEQENILKVWRAQGANVSYESVDVSQAHAVDALIGKIIREHGALHGIIHSAGVIKDNFIKRKTSQECREVLAPKVAGLVNLDNASKDVKLDFLVVFAGGAGVFGNIAQADYAAANAFLDAYSHYRQGLVAQGQRFGASVSIDWPLWAEGGMRVDKNTESMMRERLGMLPMPTATGIGALYASLNAAHAQVMVIAGDAKRIKQAVLHKTPRPVPRNDLAPARPADRRPEPVASVDQKAMSSKLTAYLKSTLSDVIQIPVHRIDAGAPFERYGIDSVLALTLTNRLEASFGSLSKTLFFEYQTIDDLSRYFLSAHASTLEKILGISAKSEKPAERETLRDTPMPNVVVQPTQALPAKELAPRRQLEPAEDAIAIIGLSGRYPQAKDLNEFWSNLVAGRDGITEVPKDRWEHSRYYDAEKNRPGKTPNKWGGFIDGVGDFDPLFFNISPREAAIMDPQTRLFLECVWNLLESSGLTRETLQSKYQSRVGVYVGAMYQQYQLLPSDIVHESITSILSYSAIANRVSHFFNLQGPSLAIDTTCSSSLIAIHMACEELRRGNCELMIAGGINLSLHPKKYLGLSLAGLTGSNPDSRAFLDGDGFIPAEGVGAVLLKSLSRAVRDGDEILAVIKTSATNHKGRTNGPMVPSPEQQAQLIDDNLRRAGVHPRTISYVEASANGSPLGDAIEFSALKKVFGKHTQDEHFCALGSVKSTLGNAEAASGVAQLSKVVLQLKHKKLLPLVKRGKLSQHFAFKGTAFYLPQEVTEWQRPVVNIDGQEREYPRRATISAFGAGGSNAHIVIEEYIAADANEKASHGEQPTPQIVIFSARNKDRLRALARQMLEFASAQDDVSLADLTHTLQRGREAMESRLAMVVGSKQELIAGLSSYLEGSETTASVPLFTGEARHDRADLGALLSGRVGEAVLKELLAENKLENLALFWAQGGNVPWESLPREGRAPRMLLTLPTYPFDKKRFWVSARDVGEDVAVEPKSGVSAMPDAGAIVGSSAAEGIVSIVSDLLGVTASSLDVNAPLEDYGFNSMLALQLVKRIQTDLDPEASLTALTERCSTQDLIRRFARASSSGFTRRAPAMSGHTLPLSAVLTRFPEVIPLNSSSTGRPVFWFHGGLGGIEVYGAIAPNVERPFYGIQARGWMTSSAPLQGISAMAAYYAQIIQAVQPEGPYDLGGYSLGGLLAYEVTRQLQAQGKTVETIVMLDSMYSDAIKTMTMSRKTMCLQLVNALLFASVKPSPSEFKATFIASSEVNWEQDDDALLDQLIALAQKRRLSRPAEALRALIKQNVRVQESYEVLKYEILPLPQPESVTCFYFRNKSGLFYGELESVFSTQTDGKALDHMNYWGEWQKQMPNFHSRDVDSSNHFAMLSDAPSLLTIQRFCEMFYADGLQQTRIEIAKKWISQS
ncbi:SDR family NAD(P)-dependent oxidoreductase [Cystobacter fuscus]|nr:SDR family NAD(P)-dependent oxidoreductase [Cystobacter fuscus]